MQAASSGLLPLALLNQRARALSGLMHRWKLDPVTCRLVPFAMMGRGHCLAAHSSTQVEQTSARLSAFPCMADWCCSASAASSQSTPLWVTWLTMSQTGP